MMGRKAVMFALVAAGFSAGLQGQGTGFFVPDWRFTGSSLQGTRQVGQATWRVENGEIVGTPTGPNGGWLLFATGYQDVRFEASYRCAAACTAGVMARAESVPGGGLKGVYVSISGGNPPASAVTVDPQGSIVDRVPLTRGAGGQIRIAPPPPPPAPAGGGARGGGGGGGAAAAPARSGGPAPSFQSMFPAVPDPVFRPNEWNTVQLLVDANIFQSGVNRGSRLDAAAVAIDAQTGSFGPIALHVAGTGEVRFKDLALRDLQPRVMPAEEVSARFRAQQFEENYYGWSAAAGDFNNDNVLDVTIGNRYYLGPGFTVSREIYLAQAFSPATQYSPAMVNFAHDYTGDGWDDVLVAESRTPVLYVNPKGESRRWNRHEVFPTAVASEAILFRDLNGDNTPDAIFAGGGRAYWTTVNRSNPTGPWQVYPITEQGPASSSNHGIGVGDVNGDRRLDVVMSHGWWEQPAGGPTQTPWRFHQAAFGRAGNAGGEMAVYDVNGDGLADIVTALEAHSFGLAWYEQKRSAAGAVTWVQHMIMDNFASTNAGGVTFTELHAMTSADVDGDGVQDIITGKRWWAHRDSHADPDAHGAGVLYLYRTVRNPAAPGGATFVPELIHNRSGVGSMIQTADLNKDGAVDIMAATAFGGHIFWGVKR
jgi:hypothetical protein